jgi:hypothetical protein
MIKYLAALGRAFVGLAGLSPASGVGGELGHWGQVARGLSGLPVKVSIALAAGGTNVMQATLQVTDADGNPVKKVFAIDFWMSEAATGIGLTGDTYSGSLTHTTGSALQEVVAKKHYRSLTDANGKLVFTITDTAEPADQYVAVRHPMTGAVVVSGASGTNWG